MLSNTQGQDRAGRTTDLGLKTAAEKGIEFKITANLKQELKRREVEEDDG